MTGKRKSRPAAIAGSRYRFIFQKRVSLRHCFVGHYRQRIRAWEFSRCPRSERSTNRGRRSRSNHRGGVSSITQSLHVSTCSPADISKRLDAKGHGEVGKIWATTKGGTGTASSVTGLGFIGKPEVNRATFPKRIRLGT